MKKLFVPVCIILTLCLMSCGIKPEEKTPERPPAFSILQKQTVLTKHSEKGENASFSEIELNNFLGESATYITVTALPDSEKGTLIFNGAAVIKGQSIPTSQLEYLKFVPSADCASADFKFTCDSKGFLGNELGCELVFGDEVNSPPVVSDSKLTTVEGISCKGKLSISEPNGDGYTINIVTYPSDGFITVSSDGSLVYIPEQGFSGKDSMVFTVTDRFGAVSERATLSIGVDKNESGLYFADMQDDMNHLYAYRMCKDNIMVYRYENGEYYFDPEAPVSKMDFLVMMMCVSKQNADIVAVADSAATDDKGLSSGLKGYLSAASEKGIVRLEDGKFHPNEKITLADAAYMISNALKLPEVKDPSVSAGSTDNTYKHILAALNAGIIDGTDPTATLTKADVAVMLSGIADYMEENNMN